jgi:spermidine/putrescine-binding protein
MVGYQLKKTLSEHGTVSRGICRADKDGNLLDINELTTISRTPEGITAGENPLFHLTGEEATSMNFWALMPDIFEKLERLFDEFLEVKGEDPKAEFYLPAAISSLIASGEATVKLLKSEDAWYGLTYPEDHAVVAKALASRKLQGKIIQQNG